LCGTAEKTIYLFFDFHGAWSMQTDVEQCYTLCDRKETGRRFTATRKAIASWPHRQRLPWYTPTRDTRHFTRTMVGGRMQMKKIFIRLTVSWSCSRVVVAAL